MLLATLTDVLIYWEVLDEIQTVTTEFSFKVLITEHLHPLGCGQCSCCTVWDQRVAPQQQPAGPQSPEHQQAADGPQRVHRVGTDLHPGLLVQLQSQGWARGPKVAVTPTEVWNVGLWLIDLTIILNIDDWRGDHWLLDWFVLTLIYIKTYDRGLLQHQVFLSPVCSLVLQTAVIFWERGCLLSCHVNQRDPLCLFIYISLISQWWQECNSVSFFFMMKTLLLGC